MHTTHFHSFRLHHDGDFEGCMYLCKEDGVEIVVTAKGLEASLDQPGDILTLSGPDWDAHDRHEVTVPPDYDVIAPGDWRLATVTVQRRDVENAIVFGRIERIRELLDRVDCEDAPYPQVIAELDAFEAAVGSFLSENKETV